jgi:cell division protein FtsL
MGAVAVAGSGVVRPRARGAARWRRLLPLRLNMAQAVALFVSVTFCCVVYVRARASVLHERYLLEQAQREQVLVQMENRTLRLAWATYTSPKVLEEAAKKQFHLRYPRPSEVVRLP